MVLVLAATTVVVALGLIRRLFTAGHRLCCVPPWHSAENSFAPGGLHSVLVLAFGHLGTLSAVTGAFWDNVAAIGVSKALGYRDGGQVADRDGSRL